MRIEVIALILISVLMSAVAQVLLKTGMSGPDVKDAIGSGDLGSIAFAIVTNPWVLGGLSLYVLGSIIWLFVLARVELSYAYPFVGLGFIFTMLMGHFFLGDEISITRFVGTLLVVLGVAFIART